MSCGSLLDTRKMWQVMGGGGGSDLEVERGEKEWVNQIGGH